MTRNQACVRREMKGRHFASQEAAGRALGRASKHCKTKKGRR